MTPPSPVTLVPGMTINSWCHICHQSTPHRWQPGAKAPLTCLKCEENEKQQERKEGEK